MIDSFQTSVAYENGYQKALLDVQDYFLKHSISFGILKMYNRKNIEMLLSAIVQNRFYFQRFGADSEFRFEIDKKKISRIYVNECKEKK